MTKSDPLGLIGACLVLAACQTTGLEPASPPTAPSTAAAEARPSETWPKIDWTGAPDCRAKLALVAEATEAGHWRPDERPPIAVVLPGRTDQADWLAPPSVTVAADLPLELHERTDPTNRDPPCLLLVEPARDLRVGQRLIGRETVRSLYESGVRSERNPEYDAAQVRVRQAERATKEKAPGVLSVGDPLLDLVGLFVGGIISGFSQGGHDRELDEATTALAATPRSIEQPVYRPYQFERQTILAGREATIPVALVDRPNRRLWRAELHRRERRQFEILDGLDPRDRDYDKLSAASVTRHDFERWQREPPQLELSAIVAALRGARPAPASDSVTAAIDQPEPAAAAAEPAPIGARAEPVLEPVPDRRSADPAPTGLDRRIAPADGLDDLLAGADAGSGPVARALAVDSFAGPLADRAGLEPREHRRHRVAAWPAAGDRAIAPAAGPAVTPGADGRPASVVRLNAGTRAGSGVYVRADLVLTTAQLVDGSSVVDVATADGARVLGLVARADRARNLALIQVARPGPPAALYDGPPVQPGRPVEAIALTEGAGVVLTPGRYRDAGAISGITGGASVDLAQIDVRSPPLQPEGLPWFLGDRVIGVGVGSPEGGADRPLGAVRAREVLDFLYGAGGALSQLP
jgi:Trypsin-like peptidase domain